MSRFRIVTIVASLCCALFFAIGQPARADEIQDINKLYKQGQNDKALERIESYLASRPKDARGPEIAQARFVKGLILAEAGKNEDAIQVFTKLSWDYPDLPEPYNNLGVIYASMGQYQKSRLAFEMAISTHPSYATAHENLGDVYARMASQAYDKALQLDKNNVTAQTKLALIKDLAPTYGKTNRAAATTEVAKSALASAAVTAPAKSEPPKPTPAPIVAAAPSPAIPEPAKPAPGVRPANAEVGAEAEAALLKTINGWASAWSSKNVPDYLGYYAKEFKVPDGESRAAWERSRRERIARPKSISVVIQSPHVVFSDASHASVTFRQGYKSDFLVTSAQKTISLIKIGDKWLIAQERVGR